MMESYGEMQLVTYGLGSLQVMHSYEPPEALLELARALARRRMRRKAIKQDIHIPYEAVNVAMQFMDADSLNAAAEVCREWNMLANQDELWKQLCRKSFGVCPSCIHPPPKVVR